MLCCQNSCNCDLMEYPARGSLSGSGPECFNVAAVLPVVPSTTHLASWRFLNPVLRKRPGNCEVSTVSYFESDQVDEPLDLSVRPKIKARQHWSGGSIVEVNDEISLSRCNHNDKFGNHRGAALLENNHSILDGHNWLGVQSNSASIPVTQSQQQQKQSKLEVPTKDESCSPATLAVNKLSLFLRLNSEKSPQQVDRSECSTVDDLRRLTDSLYHLTLSGFYYGSISWKESVEILRKCQVGTFLVRDSADPRYLYALSIQTDRGPTSVRIHYSNGCFRLDADLALVAQLPKFTSVLDMIDYYAQQWSQRRDRGQVWLDVNGRVHSDVVLGKPFIKQCPTLQHLSRLSWNRLPHKGKVQWCLSGFIPHRIQSYLAEYTFHY